MKTYKGFNKDMTCRGFQYEVGEDYETNDAQVCSSGFHACEMPLEVFQYYKPSDSVYCEVIQDGKISKSDEGTKIASSKIHIGIRLSIAELVKAQISFVFDRIKNLKEESSAATSGNWSSAATSGNGSSAAASGEESSAATSGNGSSAATSGNGSSAATSGYGSSAATSGYWSSAATSGNWSSAATSGDWSSAATSGYWSSAATSGNGSSAAASGEESSAATYNRNGIALACGKNAIAKGVVGSYIVLTEWNDNADELLLAKMIRIDGKKYKADTWYILENEEIKEVIR